MRHIIRLNAGKEIKSFTELLSNEIFEYTFVTFEYEQTMVGFIYTFSISLSCSSSLSE